LRENGRFYKKKRPCGAILKKREGEKKRREKERRKRKEERERREEKRGGRLESDEYALADQVRATRPACSDNRKE